MKRLVSIITALTLTLALLPATLVTASAADDTIVFDFGARAGVESGKTVALNFDSTTYQATEMVADKWSAEKTGNGWSAFAYSNLTFNSAQTRVETLYQSVGSYMKIATSAEREWVALMLPIADAGEYKASLDISDSAANNKNHSKRLDIYILPAPAEALETDAARSAYVEGLITANGENNTDYRVWQTDGKTAYDPIEFDVEFPQSNSSYIIVFRQVGTSALSLMAKTLTLTKQPDKVDSTVKLWVYPQDNNGTVSLNGVSDVKVGEPTTVTATANAGYTFSHWQNTNGDFVSERPSYTFTPYTNTVLYAVFKENTVSDKVRVDFYDANRDFLGYKEVDAGTKFGDITAPTPERLGYTFSGTWGIDKDTIITPVTEINKSISVVAIYDETGKSIEANVTVNNEPVSVSKYGEPVSKTISGATSWYRDENLVDYGETYTYYVWDSTAITSSADEVTEQNPIVYLDDPANGAYMIEYDEGNGTALEAGLLFGKTAEITVSDCYAKAKTQSAKAHGQFTAKPEGKTTGMEKYVRGYLIYKDTENVIRVIYTDAAEITE